MQGAYFWNFTAFAETIHGTQIWGPKYIVKTCWFTLIVLFKLENDYKRVSFVIFLIAWHLVVRYPHLGKNYDFVEIQPSLAQKIYNIPEKQNCNF